MNLDQMFTRSMDKSRELLQGTIDLHVHAGPHLMSFPCYSNPVQCAIESRDAGMRAMVLMDVINMTNGVSWLVEQLVDGFHCYGGIILNTVYGGLNPRAVMNATTYGNGARFVSFGAHSTYYKASTEGRYENGEWVLLSEKYPKFKEEELAKTIRIPEGDPGKELTEILEIIAANPQIYMVSGHVSPAEALRLGELAQKFGIKKYLVSSRTVRYMTEAEKSKAIALGALLEKEFATYSHSYAAAKTHYYSEWEYRSGSSSGAKSGFAADVRKYGAEHFVCDTDQGYYYGPQPWEGMRQFIAFMLDEGMTEEEIRMVTSINPGRLLDLND